MLILFLRSIATEHQMGLFEMPTVVSGHVKKDGTMVAPYVARRKRAPEQHHVVSAAKPLVLFPVGNHNGAMEAAQVTTAVADPVDPVNIAPEEVINPIGRPNKRDVPDYLVPRVEAIIEKANKRATRLGVEGFKLVKGEAFDKEVKGERGGPKTFVRMIPLTIEGPTIKAPGGWLLQGRVDFEDGSVIVNSRPGHELPKRFRSITPMCDHCRSDRQRNAVFVFGNGDDHMQVGRSCLKDYLGHSPEAALWAASEFGGVFDEIDEELGRDGGGRQSQLVSLDEVMTAAAWAVREHGFVSRRASDEKDGTVLPTSIEVSSALFDKKYRSEKYLKAVTQDDKDKAAAVIDWIQSEWGGKEDLSDYEYNAVELTARRAVHARRIGLLTSLVAAYDRANEEKVAREKRVDAYVGKVGERRDFKATFAGVNSFDTAYGVMWIGRFDTPEGLLVYRGSSPFWDNNLAAGDAIEFKATIKEHADYKGTKQTIISRAVLKKS